MRAVTKGKFLWPLIGSALLALILAAVFHVVDERPTRVSKPDLLGTWVSVENPGSRFIFAADGRARFQNLPRVLFESGERAEALHARREMFKPPYVSQSGSWMLYRPHENGADMVRFEQPNGPSFDLNLNEEKRQLLLSMLIGDPDYNLHVVFTRR
jgi:hypothetical protein